MAGGVMGDVAVRLLVWDDPDVRRTRDRVLVAEVADDRHADLDRLYRWLAARCGPGEQPEACLFTVVRPGDEVATAARVTTIREQGFAVHVRRDPAQGADGGGPADATDPLSEPMWAMIDGFRRGGRLREVIIASHDETAFGPALDALAGAGIEVTFIGFREQAGFACGRGGIRFIDIEDVDGLYGDPLPRTNLYDLPIDGRTLPPLRRPAPPGRAPLSVFSFGQRSSTAALGSGGLGPMIAPARRSEAALPASTAPGDTVLADTAPAGTAPENSAPTDTTPSTTEPAATEANPPVVEEAPAAAPDPTAAPADEPPTAAPAPTAALPAADRQPAPVPPSMADPAPVPVVDPAPEAVVEPAPAPAAEPAPPAGAPVASPVFVEAAVAAPAFVEVPAPAPPAPVPPAGVVEPLVAPIPALEPLAAAPAPAAPPFDPVAAPFDPVAAPFDPVAAPPAPIAPATNTPPALAALLAGTATPPSAPPPPATAPPAAIDLTEHEPELPRSASTARTAGPLTRSRRRRLRPDSDAATDGPRRGAATTRTPAPPTAPWQGSPVHRHRCTRTTRRDRSRACAATPPAG
ncbi:MAG: hypothetical protein R2749_10325 [Acidimicrobiales bacterium]